MSKIIATLIAGLFATAAFAQTPEVTKAQQEANKDIAKAEQKEMKVDAKADKKANKAVAKANQTHD
jgi:Flp pilus assembly protein TadB